MHPTVRTSAALFLFIPVLALGACANTGGDLTGDGPGSDAASSASDIFGDDNLSMQDLSGTLQERGFTVTEGQTLNQPFFSAAGTELIVDGEYVQVFEYTDDASAQQDSDLISNDATTIGTTQVTWTGDPHFFQDGRLVVLYVGSNAQLLAGLEEILGMQIAGTDNAGDTSASPLMDGTGDVLE